jgi:hypothetical protein
MAEIPPPIKLLCTGAAKLMSLKAPTVHLLLVIPVLLLIFALTTVGFSVCARLHRRLHCRHHFRLHRWLLCPLPCRLFCWLHRRLHCWLICWLIDTAFLITAHRAIDGAEGPRITHGDGAADSSTAMVLETLVMAEILPLVVLPLAKAASPMSQEAPAVCLLLVIPVLLVIRSLALFCRSMANVAKW